MWAPWLALVGITLPVALAPKPALAPWPGDLSGRFASSAAVNISFLLAPDFAAQATVNRGNRTLLAPVLHRLAAGRCLRVVALGASNTCGHCHSDHPDRPRGLNETWPAFFASALNTAFPCRARGGHRVQNLCRAGVSSSHWIEEVTSPRVRGQLEMADLVVLDTAVNDVDEGFVGGGRWRGLPRPLRRLLPQPERGVHQHRSIPQTTETLIYLLLHLPRRPALIYVGLATRLWENFQAPGPRPSDAVHAQLPVTAHYGVPYVSVLDALAPLSDPGRRGWFLAHYMSDNKTHITALGHRMVAALLVNILAHHHAEAPEPLAVDDDPYHIPPLRWTPYRRIEVYLRARPLHIPTTTWPVPFLAAAEGFRVTEDVPGKPGLIATTVGAKASFTLNSTTVQRHVQSGALHLSTLRSYHHMGVLRVQLTAWAPPRTITLAQRDIDGRWTLQVSEAQVDEIPFDRKKLPLGSALNVTLTVLRVDRPENKVKVLELVLY